MGFSKKGLRRKIKADKRVGPKAKEKAKKQRRIHDREQVKASKRKATAATAQRQAGRAPAGGLEREMGSVDALFASMDDEDASSDGGSGSDGEGAFHGVGGSGSEAGDLPAEGAPVAGMKHSEELRVLQEKDPEFYKFLAAQDQALLDFCDEEEEGGEGADDGAGAADSADEEDAGADEPPTGTVLTAERFHRIRDAARESFTATKAALNAYHAAVLHCTESDHANAAGDADEEAGDGKRRRKQAKSTHKRRGDYRGLLHIEDEATFSEVLEWTLMNMLGVLGHHAGDVDKKARKRLGGAKKQRPDPFFSVAGLVDPTHRARWSRVKILVTIFWKDTFTLLRRIAVQPMLEYVLRHCSTPEALCWLLPFQGLWHHFLKRSCTIWSTNKAHSVRLLAFLFLRNSGTMALHAPPDKTRVGHTSQFEQILKMVLKAFAAASSSYSWKSLSNFRFMENSLVELLRMDSATTYRVSYVFIRQLALVLRNACIAVSHVGVAPKAKAKKSKKGDEADKKHKKKKGALQQQVSALVAWPFIRAIYFWTKAVGTVPTLKPLAYPLYMVAMGAMKSKITNLQHFPFVFHLLLCINRLGSTLEAFAPISSHVLKILDNLAPAMDKAYRRRFKQSVASKGQGQRPATAPDLEVSLKFGEGEVSEPIVLETVGSSLCFLLTDNLGLLSQSPAFPEIAVPVLMHLKKHSKHSRSESVRQQLKSLVSAVEASATAVRARREAFNEMPSWDKFLMFPPDTAIAASRAKALERRLAEERFRVEAELRDEPSAKKRKREEDARQEAAKESKKQKKKNKKAKAAKERGEGQQKSAPRDAATPLKAPVGEDAVEEMGFSSASEAE